MTTTIELPPPETIRRADDIKLYSLVLKLRPEFDAQIYTGDGRRAHAAFIQMIAQVDPEFAEELHVKDKRKPFTLSWITIDGIPPDICGQRLRVTPASICSLRITVMGADVYKRLIAIIMSIGGISLELSDDAYLNYGLMSIGEFKQSSLARLWEDATTNASVDFDFVTPTCFSMVSGRAYTLPDPKWVYESLARNYRDLSGETLKKVDTLCRDILVTRVSISSHTVSFGNVEKGGWQWRGFSGKVGYLCKSDDPEILKMFNVLSDLAEFSGVGGHTTMGMGQMRRVRDK